jgi:membrane fusion protein, multidrug efflux system
MIKKIALAVVALLLISGTLVGVKALQFSTMFAAADMMAPPPETVSAVEARKESWQSSLRAIGSVTATQGVTVSAEVPGTVSRLSVESGAMVEAGAILVELDASTERAELQAAEAGLALAQANLRRARDLRSNNTIAESELDSALATANQAAAEVERLKAIIAKKTIRAPFAGQLGIRQVNLGQYLGTGAAIVSLQALEQVYVDFTLPQQRLALLEPGLTVQVTTDSFPGKELQGAITAINPELHVATRSIRVRATLDNPEFLLRPGMFTNVSVLLPQADDVLVIPSTAIIYAPYGNSVFVVEEAENGGSQVRQQFVRLGRNRGDFVTVTQGLEAGQTVVMTGAFKLRNGAAVTINNALAPEAKLAPSPADS